MSRIIDWAVVEKFVDEREPVEVSAGILNDWLWTAATVYENGAWKDRDKAYTESEWAIPGFRATMPNGDMIEVACHREMNADDNERSARRRERGREEMREALAAIDAERKTTTRGGV